jgi:copper chaperone CopZ
MCKTKLETGMKSQDGVLESTVDMKDKMMTVKFDPSKTSEDKIKTALAKLDVPMTSKDAKSDDCCKDKSKCSTKDAKGVKDAKDVKASKDAMDVKCTKDTKCSAPEMEKSTDVKK